MGPRIAEAAGPGVRVQPGDVGTMGTVTNTSVESDDGFELVALAAEGDRAAAGAYFQKNQRLLMAMAHRISGGVLDPDDLLSEAMITVLTKWSQGTGPERYANAYVIQTMRNRVKDELRSPRSRVGEITETNAPLHDDSTEQHSADMHREYAIVRRALGLLPEDQRAVLVATVLEGRKPADLEEELGRPASAIYSLSRRARLNLRRATLRVVLEDGAPQKCRAASAELPEKVAAAPEDSGESHGMHHIRTCARCRGAWSRFAAISLSLGVVTLLTVSGVLFPSGSAEAAETNSPSAHGRHATVRSVRRIGGRVGSWAVTPTRVGVTALAVGIAIVVGSIAPALMPPPPDAAFDVTATAVGERVVLNVGILIDRPWTVERMVISLPSGLFVDEAPPGWDCTPIELSETQCVVDGPSPLGGDFVIDGLGLPHRGAAYRVDLVAHADGRTLTAFESGPLEQ